MDFSTVKVGFIGAGNMAQALGKGMISTGNFILSRAMKFFILCWCGGAFNHLNLPDAGLLKPNQIWVNAPDDGTLEIWKTWECHILINDNSMPSLTLC